MLSVSRFHNLPMFGWKCENYQYSRLLFQLTDLLVFLNIKKGSYLRVTDRRKLVGCNLGFLLWCWLNQWRYSGWGICDFEWAICCSWDFFADKIWLSVKIIIFAKHKKTSPSFVKGASRLDGWRLKKRANGVTLILHKIEREFTHLAVNLQSNADHMGKARQ
jgi:hypothetical protein